MRQAGCKDKNEIINILYEAFYDYDLFKYLGESKKKGYSKRLKILVEYTVRDCLANGWVWLSKGGEGVCLVRNPAKHSFNIIFLVYFFFLMGIRRTIKSIALIHRFTKYHPKSSKKYVHLLSIAVKSEWRGQGIFSKMFTFLESQFLGKEIYLETSSSKNISIYEAKGYTIFDSYTFPETDIFVCMMKKHCS